MEHGALKHLFQQEFSKMVAVISKRFGLQHIALAEDIVAETFLLATETWNTKGIPPNPTAWLYTVAKQKTYAYFRRNKIFEDKVVPQILSKQAPEEQPLNFSEQNIKDSQLQMLFAICNPKIASEAQIGLALRILCGFGIDEIAEAFLSNKETINKRLFRAKEKLRAEKIQLNLPAGVEITERLDTVLHIIYLLFSEGYYSRTHNQILRSALCIEALRLGLMLIEYKRTNTPETNALMALMCFHASRFDARQDNESTMVLYEQQDEHLWDKALINKGIHFLSQSASGEKLSSYHLEARIAYCHCSKEDTPQKWEEILALYNQLLTINYSPSAALNRTFALFKVEGAAVALLQAEQLKFENNHFYFILLGELYKSIDKNKAIAAFNSALLLAKTEVEKVLIQLKIDQLN